MAIFFPGNIDWNCTLLSNHSQTNGSALGTNNTLTSPILKKRSRHLQKLNMGQAEDDIHVCIMCLRSLMNNKVDFFKNTYLIFLNFY